MHIRKAEKKDAAGIAKVHVDNWLKTYSGILPEAALSTWTYAEREKRWEASLNNALSGGTMTFVAEGPSGIAGFALSGTMRDARLRMRYSGEVYGLYVHPAEQQKGLGEELLLAAFEHLQELQHPRAALWIPGNNEHKNFFEKRGASKVYEAPLEIGGSHYTNEAYAWEDLQNLKSLRVKQWN